MQKVAIKKSFCTTREAATMLGVSVGTVQLWVESGLLQAWKTAGGHRRVLRDSVDHLLHKESIPSPVPTAPAQPSFSPHRLSVMVVEDDANLLRLYDANISRWPMAPEVTLVSNAVEALLLLGQKSPDLLITDLNMAGMDGFKMLNVLHNSPSMANTTFVVVTGLDEAEITSKGGVPAGIEVLQKPISFSRLLTVATGIINQPRFLRLPA
jgi:excisionase family DNA binding protein